MRQIKVFILIFSTFVAVLVPSFSLAAPNGSNLAFKNAPSAKFLFVIFAKHSTIKPIPGKPKTYLLTLNQVNPSVIYFTARPMRYTGHLSLTKLVNDWYNNSFSNNPPNGVIASVHLNEDKNIWKGHSTSYGVELTRPVYTANKDKVTFVIIGLSGNQGKIPALSNPDYSALFIDGLYGACPDCIGTTK